MKHYIEKEYILVFADVNLSLFLLPLYPLLPLLHTPPLPALSPHPCFISLIRVLPIL